jgi:site-specific DNA-methyltransferase (adenine-specific)
VVDKHNVIVAGHTRYKAAQSLGLKEVPVIVADDLTDDQIKAFRLADNKTGELATWDEDLLKIELLGLPDFQMSLFGFDLDEEEEKQEVEEDDYEVELPEEPKAKAGDIYRLGGHRLMCGDSTNVLDVEILMAGQKADLVVTDPPYNVNVSNSAGKKIKNDNMKDSEFKTFLLKAFNSMAESMKQGASYYVWYASSETINFYSSLVENKLKVSQELIWRKTSPNLSRSDYNWTHEPCIYGWKEGAKHYFCEDRKQISVIDDFPKNYSTMSKKELIDYIVDTFENGDFGSVIYNRKPTINKDHPTMKPLKLIGLQIKNSSTANQIVLDLFGGSGSTMMASEQLNRKCYMMEYDPAYVDVIIDRWEKLTGRKAVLERRI